MSSLEKVHEITNQLFQLASESITKDNRDDYIEKFTTLLDSREQLLTDVYPPFTTDDKKLYEQIFVWNETINRKFLEVKKQIQQDMIQLKKSKSSNQQYVNPYQGVASSDGMFYDKRK